MTFGVLSRDLGCLGNSMAQLSLEMHFEPVSSDEEEDFGDEYEPISGENQAEIKPVNHFLILPDWMRRASRNVL